MSGISGGKSAQGQGDARVSPKQPAPEIRRRKVKRQVGGREVELEQVLGRTEYRLIAPPAGSTVEVKILVDGQEWADLGPWVAEVRQGKHPRVQVRMLVDDSADTPEVRLPAPKEPEG